uniref:Immunoglobulin domain-containing protein n=1 Tax=Sinocyclocheilus anshuiensis TaxID=1608454 RepID=A0A671PGT3_9TELE
MVSLNNTVKIHNVIQNKQFTLLQMPAKGTKGLIIAVVTLIGRSNPLKSVSVMKGGSVTLNANLTQIQEINKIVWRFGVKGPIIADSSENVTLSNNTEIFRYRLQLNNQNGSLTIKNMRTKHSGLYEVQINHNTGTSYNKFNVTVFGEDTFFSKLFSNVVMLILYNSSRKIQIV